MPREENILNTMHRKISLLTLLFGEPQAPFLLTPDLLSFMFMKV